MAEIPTVTPMGITSAIPSVNKDIPRGQYYGRMAEFLRTMCAISPVTKYDMNWARQLLTYLFAQL